MKQNETRRTRPFTRRTFLLGSAAAASGHITRSKRVSARSPNETLNVACVGVGGMGRSDVGGIVNTGQNIVALCDVDWERASETFERLPDVPRFWDYRVMFDKVKA